MIGLSDPYFILLFAGHKYKSDYIRKTLDAKWSIDIQLPFLEKDLDSELKFTFWDHDMITADDHLGEMTLKVLPERILQCHSLTQFGEYSLMDKKRKFIKAHFNFSAHVECPKMMYNVLSASQDVNQIRSTLLDLRNIAGDPHHNQAEYFKEQTFSILLNLVSQNPEFVSSVADILIGAVESKAIAMQFFFTSRFFLNKL